MARITSFIRRTVESTPILAAAIATRNLTPHVSGLGTLPGYVTSTATLSSAEKNILTAFLCLFGRVPERSSLAYWLSTLGGSVTVETAVNSIAAAVSSSYILDTDPGVQIALLYHNLFAKTQQEDPEGFKYWKDLRIAGSTIGTIASSMASIGASAVGLNGYAFRNRILTAEAVSRLQKYHSRDLSAQTSISILLRNTGTLESYTQALEDVYKILVLAITPNPLSWGLVYTSGMLVREAISVSYSPVKHFRNLVWYNRNRDMMLATVYLPNTFNTDSFHRGIIALHGGGWRQGYPEVINTYCTSLAMQINPSYVVIAPTYRLTSLGYTSPSPENDVADFYNMCSTAGFLKLYPNKLGIFGESSGGHLGCLVGSTQNVSKVLAIYPPINLTGATAVSVGLDPFVDYYATNSTLQSNASPNLVWTGARTTQFSLWHGTSDTLVPSTQSGMLDTAAGTNCTVQYKTGEGHGFSQSVQLEVIAHAKSFFS